MSEQDLLADCRKDTSMIELLVIAHLCVPLKTITGDYYPSCIDFVMTKEHCELLVLRKKADTLQRFTIECFPLKPTVHDGHGQ